MRPDKENTRDRLAEYLSAPARRFEVVGWQGVGQGIRLPRPRQTSHRRSNQKKNLSASVPDGEAADSDSAYGIPGQAIRPLLREASLS